MTSFVCLHGMLGAPSSFDAVRALVPAACELVAPWLPGHGPSKHALPSTFDDAVSEMAATIPDRCVVVGYSLGGRLALALAREVSLAGLVLVGVHPGIDPGERAARAAWDDEQAALAARDLPALVDRWERLDVFASQTDVARKAQRPTRLAHDPARVAWALSALGQGRMPDLRPTLAEIDAPTRFLVGELDARLVAARERLHVSRNVRTIVVPGKGHNLILEAPHVVAEQIASLHQELS